MAVFSNPHLGTGQNDATAFPTIIEWATATNKAIAPMEFLDALHYLIKDRKITVEHLEETSLISTRTIIRLSNDPDYNVTREHMGASNTATQSRAGLQGSRKATLLSLPAASALKPGPFRS